MVWTPRHAHGTGGGFGSERLVVLAVCFFGIDVAIGFEMNAPIIVRANEDGNPSWITVPRTLAMLLGN